MMPEHGCNCSLCQDCALAQVSIVNYELCLIAQSADICCVCAAGRDDQEAV